MPFHIQEADPHSGPILRKLSASFPSRAAAQKAVKALRKAGYPARSIRVIHGPPPGALKDELPSSLVSKFFRHLGDSRQVLIGVTHHDITTAGLIFHEMGVEAEVNHFFHQNMAVPPDLKAEKNGGGAQLPSRIWAE